ncbi:sulfatase-like hydrolase/transferase [Carboxylicivirga mesophila]|uniref:Sulfatase-like hydrolase/transferase n=1 Tax=Carboxylicivirga mesophila TaxID=1166478 RepID=A0ABS5K5J9_9BACT|nr:sulfatase-like hydrolase/transferase [Carboxylicivirga mesophila]MBS2210279.1 sulfatase-like hydrolase/transferase [Carboxylicivirga mesophila]
MRNLLVFALLLLSPVLWAQQPNIIIIVADDLGNADVGYHQHSNEIPTPAIDALAKSGVYFTSGYVTAPVCGPSRAGLLTGRYQQTFGFDDNPGPFRAAPNVLAGIPPEIKIIPEYLKPEGYRTACIGKWHVGHEADAYFPTNRGFDYFYGFLGGAASYYPGDNESRTLFRNTKPVSSEKRYITDAFGQEAAQFVSQEGQEPFFLYLAFNAVHGPLQEPPAHYQEPFKNINHSKRRTLCAMQYAMDANVGKVLDALEKSGKRENTLIFFVSDNGGKIKGNYSYNMPYRGEKGTLFEGGIRLPFCMSWPAQIEGNKVFDEAVSTLDFLPTILNAVSLKKDKAMAGHDLLPYINTEKGGSVHDLMYWRINHRWAIRNSEWKLVKNEVKGRPMLFNIANDKTESTDLYEKHPEVVKELQEQYTKWSDAAGPKQWGWSPAVGKYVRHPHEDFESINAEQFLPWKNMGQPIFASNPQKDAVNGSDNCLMLQPEAKAGNQKMAVIMKTSAFQRRQRYLNLNVKIEEPCEVLVEIKGNKGQAVRFKPVNEAKADEGWQKLEFDCQAFKGAVGQIAFIFQSTSGMNRQPVYLDDISFSSVHKK